MWGSEEYAPTMNLFFWLNFIRAKIPPLWGVKIIGALSFVAMRRAFFAVNSGLYLSSRATILHFVGLVADLQTAGIIDIVRVHLETFQAVFSRIVRKLSAR